MPVTFTEEQRRDDPKSCLDAPVDTRSVPIAIRRDARAHFEKCAEKLRTAEDINACAYEALEAMGAGRWDDCRTNLKAIIDAVQDVIDSNTLDIRIEGNQP